jgi:excinuclease UvrABC nuclease subunit
MTSCTWSGSAILTRIPGLAEETGDLLLHGLGSIENVMKATTNEIFEKTPLDTNTAKTISNYFGND